MSESQIKFDKVDCAILERLLVDSRMSYQEIAKELIVSPGTIHVRLNKMKEAGIIKGSKVIVDFSKLDLEVTAFIGVNLNSAKDYQKVLKRMESFPEVTDVHYTTGQYSMFVKIMVVLLVLMELEHLIMLVKKIVIKYINAIIIIV